MEKTERCPQAWRRDRIVGSLCQLLRREGSGRPMGNGRKVSMELGRGLRKVLDRIGCISMEILGC